MANTLRNVVIGVAVGAGGLAAFSWWRNSPRPKILAPLTRDCGPLSIDMGDETKTPRFARMMALYAECTSGVPCSESELESLLEYIDQLCPDTDIEKATLEQAKVALGAVRPERSPLIVSVSPRFSRFFVNGRPRVGHAVGDTDDDKPCCAACAVGKPCAGGSCQRPQPIAAGRA